MIIEKFNQYMNLFEKKNNKKENKNFIDDFFQKLEEIQREEEYNYYGLRADNKKYKIGDVLDYDSKHTIGDKEVKGMKGVCCVNACSFLPKNILKANIKRMMRYSIPMDVVNKYLDKYNNFYILGSNKINKTKKYLTTLDKEVQEVRLIKPIVLASFTKDLKLEDYKIKFEDLKQEMISLLVDSVSFFLEIVYYGEYPVDLYNKIKDIVLEEIENKKSNEKSLKKMYDKIIKILKIKTTKFPYKDNYFYLPLTDYKKLYNDSLFSLIAQKTSFGDYLDKFYSGKFEYPPYYTEPVDK